MGKAKSVSLESRNEAFSTQGEAQDHFMKLVKSLSKEKPLTSGQDFEELKEIYTLYCQYTNYKLDRLNEFEITGFKADYTTVENKETHSTTLCCFVIFSNSKTESFSINKAIKAIADKQN